MDNDEELNDLSELVRLNKVKKTHVPILIQLARAGGRARFSDIHQRLGGEEKVSKSTLKNRLDSLAGLGVITYREGVAELRNKATLCYIVGSNIPYAYLGLLGMKREIEDTEPETETAVNLLKEEGINLEKICVVTTPEALDGWSRYMREELWRQIEPVLVKVEEMNDIDKMIQRVKPKLLRLIGEFKVILDCTSGTRPAGIALYSLAERYKLPLIYVYKDMKRIYWLKSKEAIKKELAQLL